MRSLLYASALALLLVFQPAITSGQVAGSIRDASDNHSSNCNSDNSSSGGNSYSSDDYSSSSSSSDDYDSDDGSEGVSFNIRFARSERSNEPSAANLKLQARKLIMPRIVSFEAIAPFGHNLNNYNTFTPVVRAHYGAVSWGLRASTMFEPRIEGPDDYWWTMDIELLDVNIINKRWGRLRVGTGMSIEAYSRRFFHEYNAAFDLFLKRDRFFVSQEVRISTDYCNCGPQRKEYNAALNILLLEGSGIRLYNSLNVMHQRYYGLVSLSGFGAGLRLMLF